MTTPLITSRTDWNESLLQEVYTHIEEIALGDLGLDVYPNQIEVISAEQMIDAYASIGLPVHYHHWSFGKQFLSNWNKYQKGRMGLAYEIVINSNPCISYLMEENDAITQALVMAHAAFGHNFVFKHNYMFKEWTTAGSIIDYMIFAKNYIRDCEEKYGEHEVELVLDAAHSLANHAVDKRKRRHKRKLSEDEQRAEQLKREEEERQNFDIIIKTTSRPAPPLTPDREEDDLELSGDEENLLYFIYKNAPNMEPWKREILRIVHKIRQYFYPQGQDKVLNEGMATFTHFYIMSELERKGIISPDAQLAWLAMHSNVIYQPEFTSRHYSGFNPYALGLAVLKEVRRVCEEPTKEDEEWFPNLVGRPWRPVIRDAVTNYRDESFIEQFMTPKLIRDWRLFALNIQKNKGVVREISDDQGYREVRATLAQSYNPINYTPDIVVRAAKLKKDRKLVLEYRPYMDRLLHKDYAEKTMKYVKYLWGYEVEMVQLLEGHEITIYKA